MVVPAGRPRRHRGEEAAPADGGAASVGAQAEAVLRQASHRRMPCQLSQARITSFPILAPHPPLQLFSVQDGLTEAQAAAVAARTGCTPEAALAFFAELRSSAARCLQQAWERAAGAGMAGHANGHTNGGSQLADAAAVRRSLDASAATRRAAVSKLQALLDADAGLRDMSVTGPFVGLMGSTSSSVARTQAAAAIVASRRGIRRKLVGTGGFAGWRGMRLLHGAASDRTGCMCVCRRTANTPLPAASPLGPHAAGFLTALEGWLTAAQQGEQYSLLQAVLAALAALPLEPSLLRSAGSSSLVRAVRGLQRHPHPPVAGAAENLAGEWQQALAPAAPQPSPKRPRSGGGARAGSLARMRPQREWQPPPAADLPDCEDPVAFGEDSTEAPRLAPRLAQQWRAGPAGEAAEPPREQLLQQLDRTKQQPPAVLPYVPLDSQDAAEQEQYLRAGGWRPPAAS